MTWKESLYAALLILGSALLATALLFLVAFTIAASLSLVGVTANLSYVIAGIIMMIAVFTLVIKLLR